jgi:hypothetical protein
MDSRILSDSENLSETGCDPYIGNEKNIPPDNMAEKISGQIQCLPERVGPGPCRVSDLYWAPEAFPAVRLQEFYGFADGIRSWTKDGKNVLGCH